MLTTGYLIAIGLFVFGFVILALLWLLNTIETNNYKNKIAIQKRLQQLKEGK